MKPAQRTGWNALRPENERAGATAAQYLLRRPQRICCLLCADVKKPFKPQPDVCEPKPVRQVWGLDERNGSAAQRAERGPQQPHLADARLLNEQVYQTTEWPPAARKFGGQRGIACVYHASAAARELGRPPQGRMQSFRSEHDGHDSLPEYCIKTQYNEGSPHCGNSEAVLHSCPIV